MAVLSAPMATGKWAGVASEGWHAVAVIVDLGSRRFVDRLIPRCKTRTRAAMELARSTSFDKEAMSCWFDSWQLFDPFDARVMHV